MKEESVNKELLKGYLLGGLSEAEVETVEARLFDEPLWLDDLLASRDDLLDAWVRGELAQREEQQLSARLQCLPALRGKAAFAHSLQQALVVQADLDDPSSSTPPLTFIPKKAQPPASGKTWLSVSRRTLALAALVVLLLSGGIGLKAVRWRAQRATELTQNGVPALPSVSPSAPLYASQAQPPAAKPKAAPVTIPLSPQHAARGTTVANFLLSAAVTRGEQDAPELVVPSQAKTLRLQLELDSPKKLPPQALLQTASGTVVWQQARVRTQVSRGIPLAICEVPVGLLAEEVYQLRLTQPGAHEVVYRFRLNKPAVN
ncbi:MAG: hypothetical protein HYR56_27150 [Acidobacteria bacterium]|nr:hypothetical protein [Acidobacteriota bacterium]MBI3425891.1 hypothetical protein [Acidobacteriota bacterium]